MPKKWTDEDKEFLKENLGRLKIEKICAKLNRSEKAVRDRMYREGINSMQIFINFNMLSKACSVDGKTPYRWTKHGLKYKRRKILNRYYNTVSVDSFWEWAKDNKHKLNFAKIERGVLLPEPEWLDEAVKESMKNKKRNPKKWTNEEDGTLIYYVNIGLEHKEIAERMGRSKSSIEHRFKVLTDKGMANKKKIIIPYSEKEKQLILELESQGLRDKEIAREVGRNMYHVIDFRRRMREKGEYKGRKGENANGYKDSTRAI